MKYYVRKNADSVIEGPFELEAIRGWIAGGRFTNDFEAIEDNGRTLDQLRLSRLWQRLEEVFAEPMPPNAERSPGSFLALVRQNSCYKTLRLFVNLTTVAIWIAVAVTIYLEMTKDPALEGTTRLIMAAGVLFLISLALIAVRQSALLFADIADILIEQNRRR
jgi:hypothetical protein